MPAWVLRTFADGQLTVLFWAVTLLPLPLWLLMIFRPQHPRTRQLANPYIYPLLLSPAVVYLYYLLITVGIPRAPEGWLFTQSEKFLTHPMVFLILWAKIQIMHLFLGATLYRDARNKGLVIPVTLLLCWLTGPLGLLSYTLRLIVYCVRTGRPLNQVAR